MIPRELMPTQSHEFVTIRRKVEIPNEPSQPPSFTRGQRRTAEIYLAFF